MNAASNLPLVDLGAEATAATGAGQGNRRATAVSLASPAAAFVTAQTLIVDAGTPRAGGN